MKMSKLFGFLLASSLLLTGCKRGSSSGGQVGKKTTYENFVAAVNKLPENHPYVSATLKYERQYQQDKTSGTENYVLENGNWTADGGTDNYISTLDMTAKTMLEAIGYMTSQGMGYEVTYYLNPLSIKMVGHYETGGSKATGTGTAIWNNEYGLLTYRETVTSFEAYTSIEKINVSYSKAGGQGGGSATPTQKEVTQAEFLNSFSNEQPYSTAYLSSKVEMTGQPETSQSCTLYYKEEQWVSDSSGAMVDINSLRAQTYIPAMTGSLGSEIYEFHYYINDYAFTMKSNDGELAIQMRIEYNKYGLPTAGLQIVTNDSTTARIEFSVTYSK